MSDTIRVLIVEREPLFRRGRRAAWRRDNQLQLVGSVGTAEDGYRPPTSTFRTSS